MHIPSDDSYFTTLAQYANVLIPALGGVEENDEEEEGSLLAYLALGQICRFFFHPARTPAERTQVLAFLNYSLEVGGESTETAIVLETFTAAYYYNEPFTSLFHEQLSPAAWELFLTQRDIERQRGIYTVTEEGQSRPYAE
jgi:hypothetical protein